MTVEISSWEHMILNLLLVTFFFFHQQANLARMIVRYCRKHLKDLHCFQKSSRWSVSRHAQIDAFPCIVWECILACFLYSRYASFLFYFLLDQQQPPTVSIFFSLSLQSSLSFFSLSVTFDLCLHRWRGLGSRLLLYSVG